MSSIKQLQISYPDFQLNTVIDPEQFDTNNLEIVTKINELIEQENTNTDEIVVQDTDIANVTITANNANTTANSANSKSDNAVSTANSANTKADNAVTTANTASANASNAVITANSANTTALAVQTDYNTVKPQLLQAVADVAQKVNKSYVDDVAKNYTLGIVSDNSITEIKMADEMKKGIVGGVAKHDDLLTTNSNIIDISICSTYKLNVDSNGIYTEVDYKRQDGTLIMKSIMSGGSSPAYTTRTETWYKTDGTTVDKTKVYTITYSTENDPISEVLQ